MQHFPFWYDTEQLACGSGATGVARAMREIITGLEKKMIKNLKKNMDFCRHMEDCFLPKYDRVINQTRDGILMPWTVTHLCHGGNHRHKDPTLSHGLLRIHPAPYTM